MEIRRIETGEIDAVLEVFANNFFDNQYYKGMYKGKTEMMDDFRECMTWTLENGWNMGAYDGGNLVGMALTFPLRKLDDHMFKEFFGEPEYSPSGYADGLYHRMKDHIDCIYIFAVCVNEEHRRKGIANELFSSILDPCEEYIADVTDKIARRMLGKRHFLFNRMKYNIDWWEEAYRTKLYERDATQLPDEKWYNCITVERFVDSPFDDGTAWHPEQSGLRAIYGKPLHVGDTLSMLFDDDEKRARKLGWFGFYPVKGWGGRTYYGAEYCTVVGIDEYGISLLYSIESDDFKNYVKRIRWEGVCGHLASGFFRKTDCFWEFEDRFKSKRVRAYECEKPEEQVNSSGCQTLMKSN